METLGTVRRTPQSLDGRGVNTTRFSAPARVRLSSPVPAAALGTWPAQNHPKRSFFSDQPVKQLGLQPTGKNLEGPSNTRRSLEVPEKKHSLLFPPPVFTLRAVTCIRIFLIDYFIVSGTK